jgi:hypothetical protein
MPYIYIYNKDIYSSGKLIVEFTPLGICTMDKQQF